jgi:hypothetical protein
MAGDWARAIAGFDNLWPDAYAETEKYAEQGSELRRLRIVEQPVSPYLLLETQWFKILVEEGASIRVLDSEQVRGLERDASLPEILVDEHTSATTRIGRRAALGVLTTPTSCARRPRTSRRYGSRRSRSLATSPVRS